MFYQHDAESPSPETSQDQNGFADASAISDSGEECALSRARKIPPFQLSQFELPAQQYRARQQSIQQICGQ
jgi:hypothetical protein